jgi:hypothetical protein
MLGHMDLIHKFYHESDKEFGIICEDDILIHTKLAELLPLIVQKCIDNNIELLLIGYLLPWHINDDNNLLFNIDENYKLYKYEDHLWGGQMYMVSKTYAKFLLDNYGLEYGANSKKYPEKYIPYESDWIITKKSINRAMLYPPLCIEDGKQLEKYKNEYGQLICHELSYSLHVNEHFI